MNIPLPTSLDIKESKGNKATVTIEPCYPGYGVTLGNSLRRVLLSSIDGAAITSIKVKGAQHEFSSLPLVKEDLVEIILNIKKIRLKSFSDEPVVLNLSVSGEKAVTAGDIDKNAQVEIINPDAEILHLTDKKASLEMELVAEKGMGYVTVDERSTEKADIGSILVDAIYSPVVKVGFEIENVRVGEHTDFERLVLMIETDGSVGTKEVMAKASQILVDHFTFSLNETSDGSAKVKEEAVEEETTEEETKEEAVEEEEAETKPKRRGRPKKSDK